MKFLLYLASFLSIIIDIISIYKNKDKLQFTEEIKYLEYSFKRNLTLKDSYTPEDFFKTYFYNQLYINLRVGSNKLEIPFYFYLQQYPLVIESSNVPVSEVKGIYDETKSNSYMFLDNIKYFENGDLTEGILSKDYFYFKNNPSYLHFYLSKNNTKNTHITEGGKIGFRPYPIYGESESVSFITNLKDNDIISSKIFSIKYDSNNIDEDTGKLYIGTYPHLFDQEKYSKNNYIVFYGNKGYEDIDWIYTFREVKIDNKAFDLEKESLFYSELGFIIGTENFFKLIEKSEIWREYLYINKKCHKQNFRINDFEGRDFLVRFFYEFTGYFCDNDVDIEKLNLGNLSFFIKDNNNEYTFNITNRDIWIDKNGYKYFMIIQTANRENIWFLGKPFLKKYQMVFEYDNKIIGFYSKILEDISKNNESHNNKFWILIIFIIILLIIIIGLGVLLIRYYYILPRKKRANELIDDNYEYSENNINE